MIWWWLIGVAIVALVLVLIGRFAGRATIAGQVSPSDTGPDLKASEKDQAADIEAGDDNPNPSNL